MISETGLAPGAVWLEITEDTLAQDRDASDHALRQLHEIGVRLVIDDFGTGASSLVSLKQFPFDAIKIDRAFVADLGARPRERCDLQRDRRARALAPAVRDRGRRRDAGAVRGAARSSGASSARATSSDRPVRPRTTARPRRRSLGVEHCTAKAI